MDAMAKTVEEISAEISSLKEQRNVALSEAERAVARLQELSERRATLPSGTFSTEGGAAEEQLTVIDDLVKVLDEESGVLLLTKALAEDAARELDRRIVEAEVRYHEAEKRLAKKRYEELCRTRYSVDGEAERVMADLVEVLKRLESVHAHQIRTAAEAEESYLVQEEVHDMIESWLTRRLGRWLALGSLKKYDEPLPELDPLALKPEPERESLGVGDADAADSLERPGSKSAANRHPLAEHPLSEP
jgi:chromosome segregation ATPase